MRTIAPLISLSSLLLMVVACQSSSGPAPSANSTSTASASSSTAAASGSAAALPSAPAEASAYSIVVEAPDPVALTIMKGGAIASISGIMFLLGEGPLTQDPQFSRGIKK